MWYIQQAANQSDNSLSFFDCKDLYEKAYAHKRLVRNAVSDYCAWIIENKSLTDPLAISKSVILGRVMKDRAKSEILKFRLELAKAEAAANQYKAQISGSIAA